MTTTCLQILLFEFCNCVSLFDLKELNLTWKRISKVGCCFLVSCTAVSSTHEYMMSMLLNTVKFNKTHNTVYLQHNSYECICIFMSLNWYELCNFYRIVHIMLSENIYFWLIWLIDIKNLRLSFRSSFLKTIFVVSKYSLQLIPDLPVINKFLATFGEKIWSRWCFWF